MGKRGVKQKVKQRGGQFSEGDFGCVVYPGLSSTVDPLLVVTKTFKDISEKRREEYKNETIISRFPNDFIVKPVEDAINPHANPEIRQCMMGEDKHPVTDQEIINNSILYEYLGQTYENIFRVVPADPRPYLDALLSLTLKVIDMNMAGLNHNDINGKNVTYKDGKAYLIDIGLFEHEPRSTNFQDIQELLKILYRIDTIMDQGYKARLQAFTVTPIRKNNIEELRQFLILLLQHIRTLPLAAPLALAPPSQIEVVVVPDPMMEHPMVGAPSQGASAPKRPASPANSTGNYAGGTRKKRTKAKGKAKTKAKRRLAH